MIPQPMFTLLTVAGALVFLAAGYLAARLRAADQLVRGGAADAPGGRPPGELVRAKRSAREADEQRQLAERELEETRDRLLEIEHAFKLAREAQHDAEQERDQLVERNYRLETNLELVTAERASLRESVEMAASRSDPEVEQRLRDAEHQSRRLRVTVEMLEHDHRAVLTQMEQARQQLESVQSDRAMLVTRARNQETMITKLEREKRELRRRQRWTDQQTTSLQHEQGALLAELARREYELKQAESGSEQLQDLLRQAREEIKRLADDRDTADARAGERARELSEARAALLETEQEAQHLADELEQLQETAGSAADEAPQDQQPRVPGPEEPAPESAETSNLEVTLVQAAEEREESEEDTREVAALDGDPAQTVDLGPVGSREETREMAPVLLDDEQVAHLEALVAELGRVQTARGAVVTNSAGQLVVRDSDEADGLAVAANTLTEAGAKIRELLPLEELLYVALVDEDKLTVTALPLDGYGEPLILGTLSQGPGPTREVVDRLLQR
jgi:hypothetical protein